jgi:hypothetical protein
MKLHCGAPRPLNKTNTKEEGTQMNKVLLALALLASLSTETFAQHAGTDQDEKACIHDVERLCRKWMDQGDFTILACLKENRTRLHQACRDVLVRHGQ